MQREKPVWVGRGIDVAPELSASTSYYYTCGNGKLLLTEASRSGFFRSGPPGLFAHFPLELSLLIGFLTQNFCCSRRLGQAAD